ncbi:MAG: carboxylating nicotinate-nucleotide diphosphorylase [Chloroherpetonaceae bacterium]|nr:carboxylating nicotinate-nucleotide diphosphorylase [Chthonomonadaceae bacterium]MDW8208668.1 carboxylating nicotinate-nucleotide diphosphorylase [Chloroherpetonaceae bacterium]
MPYLPSDYVETVRRALQEDVGTGDITTLLTVPAEAQAHAVMLARQDGVVAGLPVAQEVFRQVDPSLQFRALLAEGASFRSGDLLCEITGRAQAILTGERVALNFVQRLSGIATRTSRFVALVQGTHARIADTRKTTPGLRALEKYAVRTGGGFNHRSGLYDAVLIKDNHIQACGSITAAVQAATRAPHTMTITVECATLEQVDEALQAGAQILLLDNMDLPTLQQAVKRVAGRAVTEASGGVNEQTVAAIAQTGVDIISVGALTHSAPAVDISLELSSLPQNCG